METRERKRQHPLWIVLKLGSSIREVIIPIIYFFIMNMRSDSSFVKYGSIALIIYLLYRLLTIILEWKNSTYLFTDTNLELIKGRLVSKKSYVSLNRIQNVQQHTSFLHRLFGLTSLIISTGTTGDNATVKLEMITKSDASHIQSHLKNRTIERQVHGQDETEETPILEEKTLEKHYTMSLKEIIIISVTSLYFLASIPIIMSVYFKIEELFSLDDYTDKAMTFLKQSVLLIAGLSLFMIIILTLVGIVITYIRYGNYTVTSDDERIYITRGVFTKTSFSIQKEKINGIEINKGFIRRLFNIVEVELIIVGDMAEDDVKSSILFPFIAEKRAINILQKMLPTFTIRKDMKRLPGQAFFPIMVRPSYFLVLVTVIVLFFWPEYWFIPLILVAIIVFSRILEFKRSKYLIDEQHVQIQTGSFSTSLFITKREKIDQFALDQSWLQGRLNLSSIVLTTREQPVYRAELLHIPTEKANQYKVWYIKQFMQ